MNPLPAAAPGAGAARIGLKKVLVPVDFSGSARKALEYGLAFAEQFQASLALLHVIELSFLGSGLGEIEVPLLETELRQNAGQQLDRLVAEVIGNRVPCETEVAVGRPWQEITEAAKAREVDLIVMGTHGYTGLRHVVMGSTAERVVRHAACPVLVVREREHEFVAS
jgi:nucleotide-binding universal stress UspA family protein